MAMYYICCMCKRQVGMSALSKFKKGMCFSCQMKVEEKQKKEEIKNKAAEEMVR